MASSEREILFDVYNSTAHALTTTGGTVDTTNNATRTEGVFTELTGSVSSATALIPITEVAGVYRSFSLDISSAGTGCTIAVQASNEPTFANPRNLNVYKVDGQTSAVSTSFTTVGMYAGAINARYIRVQVTIYGSGTVTGILELFSYPYSYPAMGVGFIGTNNTSISATYTMSNPSILTSSTTLAASNGSRKALLISNLDAANPIFINFAGGTAVTTNVKLAANGTLLLDRYVPTTAVTAIATGGTVSVAVAEAA